MIFYTDCCVMSFPSQPAGYGSSWSVRDSNLGVSGFAALCFVILGYLGLQAGVGPLDPFVIDVRSTDIVAELLHDFISRVLARVVVIVAFACLIVVEMGVCRTAVMEFGGLKGMGGEGVFWGEQATVAAEHIESVSIVGVLEDVFLAFHLTQRGFPRYKLFGLRRARVSLGWTGTFVFLSLWRGGINWGAAAFGLSKAACVNKHKGNSRTHGWNGTAKESSLTVRTCFGAGVGVPVPVPVED